MNNKHQLSFAGEIIKLGLSVLLAGYFAKRLLKKYPGDEIPNFAKGVGGIILICSIAIIGLFILSVIIYGVYELLNPEAESIIQAAQRRLKERGG